jgi:hypothetical protein
MGGSSARRVTESSPSRQFRGRRNQTNGTLVGTYATKVPFVGEDGRPATVR